MISICSVGDLMICDSPLYASVGVGSRYPSIRENLKAACTCAFAGADAVIGNFESVVYTPKNGSLAELQMACPEDVMADLRDMGFSVLNIANNHSLQHATEGFENTKTACEKYGIVPIGLRNQEAHHAGAGNRKLVCLSVCIHLEWYQPENILYETDIEKTIKTIKSQRDEDTSAIIIVCVHWGDEFAMHPSNAQIALAHAFVDAGANVILGHHSHVYQGIEMYKGSVIAYSQGNFVSDMKPKMCRETGVLRIQINDDPKKSITWEMRPFYIGDDFIPKPSADVWFDERQRELEAALAGQYSDDDYWKGIQRNHASAHNDFKTFFKQNLIHYKPHISSRMLAEFVGRKLKRVAGVSTDGRISSMDPIIYEAIEHFR